MWGNGHHLKKWGWWKKARVLWKKYSEDRQTCSSAPKLAAGLLRCRGVVSRVAFLGGKA